MRKAYHSATRRGFGKPRESAASGGTPRKKPLKRPSQDRAKFTVQAIYDAFVRIWRSEGWAGITTRAVALDTGISVGTLYDYFPNKHALLSGYVRHAMEVLVDRIDHEVVQPRGLDWETRVRGLVRLSCGVGRPDLPHIDHEMLTLIDEIAEPKHHRRVFEELSAIWGKAFAACKDLPDPPDRRAVVSLFSAVWGARRYLMLIEPKQFDWNAWALEMERLCCARVARRLPPD
jgi:AcrR family transcriptional regulator